MKFLYSFFSFFLVMCRAGLLGDLKFRSYFSLR